MRLYEITNPEPYSVPIDDAREFVDQLERLSMTSDVALECVINKPQPNPRRKSGSPWPDRSSRRRL